MFQEQIIVISLQFFSLHSQIQIYIKDIFCMLLVISHVPTGDASKALSSV